MKHLNYLEVISVATERLAKGQALLTVGGAHPNTMTIGWGSIGFCWGKPVFTVYVRPQRHTHDILREQGKFTVSIALTDDQQAIFRMAGATSGRDVDKFSGHGITAAPGQTIDAPVVAECQLHFECVVLDETRMLGETMDAGVRAHSYPQQDYHTIYMGEIVDCYRTDI
ncbi:MAG: flavin reductase family protein [Clostridia bacterium]|nr:flavin reductase family protein [Clostridia bacterium]